MVARMGHLETKPYDAAEGKDYADYLEHIAGEADRLRRDGRLPDNDAVLEFFDDMRTVLRQVRADSARALASGDRQVVTRIEMTAAHHRRMMDMNESLGSLFEILEMRQAVDMKRTDRTARVATAVREGSYTET
jgi:hypothetical protein